MNCTTIHTGRIGKVTLVSLVLTGFLSAAICGEYEIRINKYDKKGNTRYIPTLSNDNNEFKPIYCKERIQIDLYEKARLEVRDADITKGEKSRSHIQSGISLVFLSPFNLSLSAKQAKNSTSKFCNFDFNDGWIAVHHLNYDDLGDGKPALGIKGPYAGVFYLSYELYYTEYKNLLDNAPSGSQIVLKFEFDDDKSGNVNKSFKYDATGGGSQSTFLSGAKFKKLTVE